MKLDDAEVEALAERLGLRLLKTTVGTVEVRDAATGRLHYEAVSLGVAADWLGDRAATCSPEERRGPLAGLRDLERLARAGGWSVSVRDNGVGVSLTRPSPTAPGSTSIFAAESVEDAVEFLRRPAEPERRRTLPEIADDLRKGWQPEARDLDRLGYDLVYRANGTWDVVDREHPEYVPVSFFTLRDVREAITRGDFSRPSPSPVNPAPRNAEAPADHKIYAGKLRMHLVPPDLERQAAAAMSYGLQKHGKADTWRDGVQEEYVGALLRHLSAWRAGESHDPESGLNHLAGAAASLAIVLWFEGNAGRLTEDWKGRPS